LHSLVLPLIPPPINAVFLPFRDKRFAPTLLAASFPLTWGGTTGHSLGSDDWIDKLTAMIDRELKAKKRGVKKKNEGWELSVFSKLSP